MRLSSFLFCLLFGLSMSITAWAQQPPPERTFEEILGALSRDDVRPLSGGSLDRVEKSELSKKLSKTLQTNEEGKKWTLKFVRGKGDAMRAFNNRSAFYSDPTADTVRVNGLKYYVRVRYEVAPAMLDKAKDCRPGRKMFVSGTVSRVTLFGDMSVIGTGPTTIQGANMLLLDITIEVDDLGLVK